MGFGALKLERDDYAGLLPVQEVKSLRQDANDLAGFAVHDDVTADDRSIAAKFATPIAVKKHDGFGGPRRIILPGKAAAQQGRHAEERESAIRNAQGTNLFGFGHAGHAHGVARVKTEILEGAILVAEDEVVGGGQLEFFEIDPGRSKPDADKFIGFGIWKRLEENAFENTEDDGVGSDAGGQ